MLRSRVVSSDDSCVVIIVQNVRVCTLLFTTWLNYTRDIAVGDNTCR